MASKGESVKTEVKREVKVVKKQVKKENKVEEQNGNQNGDSNIEAEMTVKLPTKKSAAKTETKVEVVKKILPDGSVEEIKTTTTKTTVDGRTEIKTKTETRTIPKEEESEEEVVEEEEEEEEEVHEQEEQEEEVVEEPETVTVTTTIAAPKENGQQSNIIKTEERSETTTTTKKVVVVEESPKEESQSVVEEQEVEEVEEEVEDAEPVTVVLKKQVPPKPEPEPVEIAVVEEEEIEENEEIEETQTEEEKKIEKVEVEQEVEEKEKVEETVEEEVEVKKEPETKSSPKDEEEEEEEYEEAEETEEKVEQETEVKETVEDKKVVEEVVKEESQKETEAPTEAPAAASAEEPKESPKEPEEKVIKVEVQPPEESKPEPQQEKGESETKKEFNIPIREPSIPLEKVEDVEIKPIGISPIITKTHTENTEIITSTIKPEGGLSTQTEYNKIENIVTVNRTTKILDNSYENLTQQGIPTVRTYFPPPSLDKISTSPLPSRPYQPVYPPEPQPERRHSLLLDRLSTERQMPSDLYQYSNQSYEQTQYQTEPQSEVLTVSNVKPSMITNQQWYQQTKQQQNSIYNNTSSTPAPVGQPWAQPKSQPQPPQQYSPQPQYQSPQPQPHYQAQHQPQPQYQAPPTPQPQYQAPPTPQPQYQPSYTEPTQERAPSSYSTYTPTPAWVSNVDTPQNTQPTQYSYLNKDTTDSYQRSTQQYSSSYVPPPWEQDSSYTSVNNTSQTFYQPAPQTPASAPAFSPAPASGWKPPAAKFSKNAPISYIPPAPNQSFVRSASVSEPPRPTPGRKTYYSEYERRYISVPDSTYIPSETKFQHQPDPSPQYYYDNNEPSEPVEPQWRKELREFTEKTSQTITTEQTSVQPPWEAEQKFAKTPTVTYTPTPSWSQTLRPRSYRERSFESEYVSQEWPKTNTLGRGRPLSTLGKSVDAPIPERTRGVSVDRYNPNNYQSPAEHPPVQSHTLTTPAPHAGYHNPNVPAYHARASAEPREQPTAYQPRVHRESRASPLQSRSFKYLQWITGTDD
ncbi:proteoglycan 4-like isoform X2 [Trichoplusia ni]|uniref:Proteoglycan 4-like isoform X2 n=1 Tax=Trichoplusia ni TaxID=7111 RepID=A0A7E5W4M6_TRINI|nr:proteoglycan 4-like isoform X2 [Trichoplusia ni]XP_026735458.1 proteoglycan 4-like isoform X2 [Trichoplusia ni]